MRNSSQVLCLMALSTVALAGCHPMPRTSAGPAPSGGREIVITEQDIQRLGVQTAWDAVRLRVPRLVVVMDAQGRATSMRTQETRTIQGDQAPLLVVDGAQVSDPMYLQDIPASDVHLIRVLEETDAERLYGLRGFNGAIVVETKRGR
jgi:TonB-dependent receptor-like protein